MGHRANPANFPSWQGGVRGGQPEILNLKAMTTTLSHTNPQLFSKVEAAIATMRPFFEADGGDMRLHDITEEMVARVQLIGSCRDCQMREMTLKGGVEEAIRRAAPEIVAVEAYEGI